MSHSLPAIKVSKLTKQFEGTTALRNISFEIKSKKIVALIGPNGSGKTTLLKTLVGLHSPTRGSAKIFGHDIQTQPLLVKKHLGYVPDSPAGFEYLTGLEFLSLAASLKQVKRKTFDDRITDLVKLFSLEPIIDHRLGTYSRGNRQKLAFLAALLGNPELLIIDEPIVGLDPDSIEIFGLALKQHARTGGTVLFSTHILEFGKRFANHALLMNHGKIKLDTTITNKTSLTKYYHKMTQLN